MSLHWWQENTWWWCGCGCQPVQCIEKTNEFFTDCKRMLDDDAAWGVHLASKRVQEPSLKGQMDVPNVLNNAARISTDKPVRGTRWTLKELEPYLAITHTTYLHNQKQRLVWTQTRCLTPMWVWQPYTDPIKGLAIQAPTTEHKTYLQGLYQWPKNHQILQCPNEAGACLSKPPFPCFVSFPNGHKYEHHSAAKRSCAEWRGVNTQWDRE